MCRSLFIHPAALLAALLISSAACLAPAAPAAAAAESPGIECMTKNDWNDMWGFYKRGLAECWLASKRHQAARTLGDLRRLQQSLPPQSPAAASVQAMQTELKAIVDCHATPSQLQEAVDRFYEAPGNSKVLLGDALHLVVLDPSWRGKAKVHLGGR